VKKIVKIGQYLAKTWTKCNSLLLSGHPVGLVAFQTVNKHKLNEESVCQKLLLFVG